MTEIHSNHALPPGTRIQEYEITDALGMGGFGIVYRAKNIYLDETVAIKEFLPTELASRNEEGNVIPISSDTEESYHWALDRFLKEAKILWGLGEPNPNRYIVRVKRYHEANGTAYMVMDFEEGEPLSDKLKDRGTLQQNEIEAILYHLLEGLESVHAESIIHRDIKPDNIFIRDDGSPVLIDFGAAKQEELGNNPRSMMAVYSPKYAPPEQMFAMGEQGPWTDIYSLGALLYHCVTGQPPENPMARGQGSTNHVPAIEATINEYDQNFLKAIDLAIEPKAEDRPQTIAEFRNLLGKASPPEYDDATVIQPKLQTPAASPTTSNQSSSVNDIPTRITKAVAPQQVKSGNDNSGGKGSLIGIGLITLILIGGGLFYFLNDTTEKIEEETTEESQQLPFEEELDDTQDYQPEIVVEPEVNKTEEQENVENETGKIPETTEIVTSVIPDEKPAAIRPTNIPAPTIEPEPIDKAAIASQIKIITNQFDCAYLNSHLTDNLTAEITGFVSQTGDKNKLKNHIKNIKDVKSTHFNVEVYKPPFCRAISLIYPYFGSSSLSGSNVNIEFSHYDALYREGEYLVVYVSAELSQQGYLYVDYMDAEGNILHMLPSPVRTNNKIQPGNRIKIGIENPAENARERYYKITPPHGTNMIMAIYSETPLFDATRAEIETIDEYLAVLRSRIVQGNNNPVISGFGFFSTQP